METSVIKVRQGVEDYRANQDSLSARSDSIEEGEWLFYNKNHV